MLASPSNRGLRVFISSTSEDLESYRIAARDVVLDLGWHPVAREHFGTDGQLGIVEACALAVEESDVVLAILAWRRGSVPDPDQGGDGKASYTKWELDNAFQHKKPVLVLKATESWPGNLWEEDDQARAWVRSFRGELDRLAVPFEWESCEQNAKEPLPNFRAKVRQELLRHLQTLMPLREVGPDNSPKLRRTIRLRTWGDPDWPPRPYPLLLPYTHPALFAGRSRERAEVRRLLRLPQPVLCIYSVSGAGKSSLLAAGLVPEMRSEGKLVALARRPAEPGLAMRLVGDLLENEEKLVSSIDPRSFVDYLLVAERSSGEPPLLILDQFEDLMRPEAKEGRALLGPLLAASVQRQPGRDGLACRWLLAYRDDFHGQVGIWLRDVLAEARSLRPAAVKNLPHDLSDSGRAHSWPLPPLGASSPGGDRIKEATRAFQEAIEKPLGILDESGCQRYPWRFVGDGSERLAKTFAAARYDQRDVPLVPELQVVLAHLLQLAGEPGGFVAEITVPEKLERVIDEALENHLRRALDEAFAGRSIGGVKEGQIRVLLALGDLADTASKSSNSISATDLAVAIGDGGAEIIQALARRDIRLILPREEGGAPHYSLSHDRLADVVVHLKEQLLGDLDADLVALRGLVRLNTKLYSTGEHEQAVRIPPTRFESIAEYREVLIRGEDQESWWAACEKSRQSERRRRVLLPVLVAIVGLVVWAMAEYKADRRAEHEVLRAQLLLADPEMALRALVRLITTHGETADTLQSDLEASRLLELLESGWGGIVENRRAEALIGTLEVVWPLLENGLEDLYTVGVLAWAIDYNPMRDARGQDRAMKLRLALLRPLRERASPNLNDYKWVRIPYGDFAMGSVDGIGDEYEQPRHKVRLRAFRMMATEVTNQQYRRLVPDHGKPPDDKDLPVVDITWYEAYAYSAWLGGRLPSEAQWEYAARAGTQSEYWSGDNEEDLSRVGWYAGNSDGRLHVVAEKQQANLWGLHDLHGNAWEWTADWYGSYSADRQEDPLGPASSEFRVVRGGSFTGDAEAARAASRDKESPALSFFNLGFRTILPAFPESSYLEPD